MRKGRESGFERERGRDRPGCDGVGKERAGETRELEVMAVDRRVDPFFEDEVGQTSSSEGKQRRGFDAFFPSLQDESRHARSERPRCGMHGRVHPWSCLMAIDKVVSHLRARSSRT